MSKVLIAALLGLLCGGWLTSARAQNPGDVGFAYGDRKDVRIAGRLVSLPSEMAAKYGADIAGASPQVGLVTPEGRIYTFLATAIAGRELGVTAAGKAVEVNARLFPRSSLLELLSLRPIDPVTLQRRFFCGVCTIYGQEYGPCACCGREMELVKDAG